MCKVCERAGDGEDKGINKSMNLGNGMRLENVGTFWYLGVMLNGGGVADSASVERVRCAWRKFKELSAVRDLDEEGGVFKAEREGVYDVCEERDGVWK